MEICRTAGTLWIAEAPRGHDRCLRLIEAVSVRSRPAPRDEALWASRRGACPATRRARGARPEVSSRPLMGKDTWVYVSSDRQVDMPLLMCFEESIDELRP